MVHQVKRVLLISSGTVNTTAFDIAWCVCSHDVQGKRVGTKNRENRVVITEMRVMIMQLVARLTKRE